MHYYRIIGSFHTLWLSGIVQENIILKQNEELNYRLLLTITCQQLPRECKGLIDQVKDNVVFLGSLTHQEVMKLYCTSVLVFPSYIETYGLPLKEASLCGAPIIAADRPFSREILEHYENKFLFPLHDAEQLAKYMMHYLEGTSSFEVMQ